MDIAEGLNPTLEARVKSKGFDWSSIVKSEAFWPGVLIVLGLGTVFWSLITFTVQKWAGSDGYYSHGFLVPAIAGYIVYRWWPKLKTIPVKPGVVAIPLMIFMMWIAYVANRTDIYTLLSLVFVVFLLLGTWAVAGWRWMLALAAPILYLLFAMPIWDPVINAYTNPLQLTSAKVAFQMLKLMGMAPYQESSTLIYLSNYKLDVGAACSGLKLILALTAFGTFFMLIARLKVWANLVFAASLLPIALFLNGLRISLIGVVGNTWGENAGAKFHDYSGYIVIVLCFFVLDRWAKVLGWKEGKAEDAETQPASPPFSGLKALKKRSWALGAAFLACGGLVLAAPKPQPSALKTESWMESKAPAQIGSFKVKDQYKMDPSTYAELQPYGIVCRVYESGTKAFDVVLVASNKKTSFHDPRVCFPAQGWSFDSQNVVQMQTKTRGSIPVTIISMTGSKDNPGQIAAFFYRGRNNFYATPQALSWSMFVDQFEGHTDIEGVFYRFMPSYPDATQDELIEFIRNYMDEAPKTSGGFF